MMCMSHVVCIVAYDRHLLCVDRESPSIYICQYLLEEGALLAIYDPKVEKDQIISYVLSLPF